MRHRLVGPICCAALAGALVACAQPGIPTAIPTLPTATSRPAATANLPAIGGSWSTGTPLPAPRSEIAAAVLDGRLYVAGGFGVPRGVILGDFLAYDPATERWTELARLPEPRHHAALTSLGGRLYLTGGGVDGFAPRANTWAYDPATDHWTALAPMPEPRRAHATLALNDRLYVVGGVIANRTLQAPTWAYDPATSEWRDGLAPIPTYSEHLAAAAVDGAIVAIGGRGTQNVDAVERYDPATDTWAALAPLPTARSGLTASLLDGGIHVIGGESADPPKVFRDHEVFDVASGAWSVAPPLDRGRHGLGSGVIDGRLYVVGGGPNPDLSYSDRLDIFTP